MKHLFLSMAAVAMLASCSSDEIIDKAPAQKSAIGFSTFVDKSTRGASDDITNENITNFSVWGFMDDINGTVFTGEPITGSGVGDKAIWTYTNKQYWTAGKKYYFSAIAPTVNPQWSYTPDNIKGGDITFTNGTGEQDLLYAYSGEITCNNDPSEQGKVEFIFKHLLSRVKFKFTNGLGNTNATIQIKNVTITDAVNKASIDMSAGTLTWTKLASGSEITKELVFGDVSSITKGKSGETDHLYMIPQEEAYKLSFTVEMYQGTNLAQTFNHTEVVVPSYKMEPGYSYVFETTLNADNIVPGADKLYPIEFTVSSVNGWQESFTNGGSLTLKES